MVSWRWFGLVFGAVLGALVAFTILSILVATLAFGALWDRTTHSVGDGTQSTPAATWTPPPDDGNPDNDWQTQTP